MKMNGRIICVAIVLIMIGGCANLLTRSPEDQYLAKAKKYEKKGNMVDALEQYKLVLTVNPANQAAKEKSTKIEGKLKIQADKHYHKGLIYHRKGQYKKARKEFLISLRYNPEHSGSKRMMLVSKKEVEQAKRYILHTVQPGESISRLADRYYGDHMKFHLIAEYNELEDATSVKVGKQIKIPVIEGVPIMADVKQIHADSKERLESTPEEIIIVNRFVTHTIQKGESLSRLAKRYYGDYKKFDLIAKFNNMEDIRDVQVGKEIKIPEVKGVPFLAKAEEVGSQQTEIKENIPQTGEVEPQKTEIPGDIPPAQATPVEEEDEKLQPEVPELAMEDQAAAYRDLGIELFTNQKYEDAISELKKVLNVNPEDKDATKYLSMAYFEKGVLSVKGEAYQRAIEEFEASWRYDKNCEKCEKYIEKSKEIYKDVHYNNGCSYFRNEKLADAIREWELVYTMDSRYKDVDQNLEKARKLLQALESIKNSKIK
ncbi:MAG: LysM peptidoglycan-binding domain-containing protein [Deltaproteobacteria bacterium]|nr:LysM peptidoglycan-binding domain-containing protein [Deltaproteobacteria bacterium]